MATGDNVLTAISVAKECFIVDPEIEVFLGELKSDG
jgi:magnesium-transporting ATPase (P-type)